MIADDRGSQIAETELVVGNGYETRQTSKEQLFVMVFSSSRDHDPSTNSGRKFCDRLRSYGNTLLRSPAIADDRRR